MNTSQQVKIKAVLYNLIRGFFFFLIQVFTLERRYPGGIESDRFQETLGHFALGHKLFMQLLYVVTGFSGGSVVKTQPAMKKTQV